MSNLNPKHHQTFEGIRQESADGTEYWSARDLQPILEYNSWDKFKAVIHKAIKACKHSEIKPLRPFFPSGKNGLFGIRCRTANPTDYPPFSLRLLSDCTEW